MSANKLRLLILTSTYPRWQGDAEPGFVHELARRLTNSFEIIVLCPHTRGAAGREMMDGIEVRRYRYAVEKWETLVNDGGIVTNLKRNPLMWLLVPLFLLAQVWATWRLVRRWRPDVIHAHWLIPQGLVVALLSLFYRNMPPILGTSHGADLHALRFWPMPALKQFVARRAAAITVVSAAMLDAMEAQGIPTQGVRVEPMGVDLENRFTPDESVRRSRDEILFVGRLVEKKGLRYLIEAMPGILANHPDAYLTVAGFGPEEPALGRQAETFGIADKVHFIGAVPQERLPGLYRRAAVFVAPFVEVAGGDQEGLGLVTVEAIGCGCPVVVSAIPATEDVVTDTRFLIPPGDPEGIARAVSYVLTLEVGERRLDMEKLQERLIDRFDWQNVSDRYEAILKYASKNCSE